MRLSQRKTIKPRECLRCGQEFRSRGNWNRMCPRCVQKNATISLPPEARSETRRGHHVERRRPTE